MSHRSNLNHIVKIVLTLKIPSASMKSHLHSSINARLRWHKNKYSSEKNPKKNIHKRREMGSKLLLDSLDWTRTTSFGAMHPSLSTTPLYTTSNSPCLQTSHAKQRIGPDLDDIFCFRDLKLIVYFEAEKITISLVLS